MNKYNETFLELCVGYLAKVERLFVSVVEEVNLERRQMKLEI